MEQSPSYDEARTAALGNRADRQVDKFFQRAPFLYGLLIALLAACATGGAWTATLQSRIHSLEDFKFSLEHDVNGPILEQAHANRKDIDRNLRQIRALNLKAFPGLPDPGE